MPQPKETRLSNASTGALPTTSVQARPDHGENSASTIVEAPVKTKRRLDAHDFPDGGGSGGPEAFSRRRIQERKPG